ncbi:MAG: response regulator [Gemmataceae bacterium]|nr:response regulator [Gemmataceae bacterium]
MAETILIVDDEEPVRQTFREWLDGAHLEGRVLVAGDAESALVQANQQTVDLAILDWNLGAGNDGLQLLEDLRMFSPEIVAIMITGYAHQATPLDAMRMGVRDYLDKNQDLNRNTFLKAVQKQLEQIRPAKRERQLHDGLLAFREAVAKILPLVETAAALNDPVPLPEAIGTLFRFLLRTTGARDGVLLVRSVDPERRTERCQVYDTAGRVLNVELVPFARSVAGSVVSLQEPAAMNQLDQLAATGSIDLQPFERGRKSLLAASLAVAANTNVVLELFDKPGAFGPDDHRLMGVAADFGAEMLRQALAERQTRRALCDAVAAALSASESLVQSLTGTPQQRKEQPPPDAVIQRLREGLSAAPGAAVDAAETLRLVEAVRVLALRHGAPAVQHCIRLVESLRSLLDTATGAGN